MNDVAGLAVDVAVGQFQVLDPLYKRELRLEDQDYAVYRARMGDQPADMTYDRGIMVAADLAGFTVTGGLGYLVARNFRVYGEGTWSLEGGESGFTLGLTTAF